MTAIRETFEETGVLLASSSSSSTKTESPSISVLDEVRKNVHSQKATFRSFLDQYGLSPKVSALLPFTQWITPTTSPKYDVVLRASERQLLIVQYPA
jgi:8-oxo-dGTP pyrophosphatase MutT (NUDIX family)